MNSHAKSFALVCLAASFAAALAGDTPPADVSALPHEAGTVRITWTDVTADEDGFVLQRSVDAETWTTIADIGELPPDSTAYVDTPGPARERYFYRVASSHGGVLSPWSAVSSAVPVYSGKPLYGWIDATQAGPCTIPGVSDPHPIQCAIEQLGGVTDTGFDPAVGPHVLWFPNGEYLVDRTLWLEGHAGVQFVGQSSGGVVLRWTGAPGSGPDDLAVMFHAEGNRDSTWRNLVWDAGCQDPANCFVVAFDQSFCGRSDLAIKRSPDCGEENLGWPESDTRGVSDNGGAHFDSVFRNAYVGLRLGHYGVADDSTTYRRCRWENNFVGVSLEDFNALSHYVWDSRFEANFVGISNDLAGVRRTFDPGYSPGTCVGQVGEPSCYYHSDCETGFSCVWTRRRGGDFNLFRGRFADNLHTDVWADPTGDFVLLDNWSTGTGRFFFGGGLNATPGRFSLIGNTVWDTQGPAIETRTPGAFLLLDNRVYTDPAAVEAPVVLDALVGYDPLYPEVGTIDLVAIGNVWTLPVQKKPFEFKKAYRLREVDSEKLEQAPPVAIPPLPIAEDALEGRPVYTVTEAQGADPAANAARIQQVIDLAIAAGQPAIVHFPGGEGRYAISQTLQVPAGSSLTLVGDGAFTTLWWLGTPGEPLLRIDAADAADVTVRDLQVLSAGIAVDGLAQQDVRAFASQLRVAEPGVAGIFLDEVDATPVDLTDMKSNHGRLVGDDVAGTLIRVGEGDGSEPAGAAFWSGETNLNHWDYVVLNGPAGARVLINAGYTEKSRHHLRIVGNGYGGEVAINGSKLAPSVPLEDPDDPLELAEATATVSVEDFSGTLGLVVSQMFVVPPDSSSDTHPVALDYGTRVRVVGSQPVAADLGSVGITILRQPRIEDPDNAWADSPEYDFSAALPNTVDYLRLGSKRAIDAALPLPDARTDELGDPQNPELIGEDLSPADQQQLLQSVALLRGRRPPGFYDEPGDPVAHGVNFDKVFVYKAPTTGLLLAGGRTCFDAGECDDGISCTIDDCDQAGLPAGVAGQCRHLPDDAMCADGSFCNGVEICASDGCAPGADPCPGEGCDEETDLCYSTCDNDGVCGADEDCQSCPADCFSVIGGVCGNAVCEPAVGEDCLSCPEDCRGKQTGGAKGRYCCGDGDGFNPVGCDDPRCETDELLCNGGAVTSSCCGNGTCEGVEDSTSCPVDCPPAPLVCGNGACDPWEDTCSCPVDCGSPPASESLCDNSSDDDCDGAVDCVDPDCQADPICQLVACDGDGICDPGEDCESCPGDCVSLERGPPLGRHCCGNGILEDGEGDGLCDGNP